MSYRRATIEAMAEPWQEARLTKVASALKVVQAAVENLDETAATRDIYDRLFVNGPYALPCRLELRDPAIDLQVYPHRVASTGLLEGVSFIAERGTGLYDWAEQALGSNVAAPVGEIWCPVRAEPSPGGLAVAVEVLCGPRVRDRVLHPTSLGVDVYPV